MQKTLTHIHFWFTIVGMLLVSIMNPISHILLIISARSTYLSLVHGIFSFADIDLLSKFCINWFLIFSLVYIVLYILGVVKKRYHLFGIAIVLDTAFRCITTILIHLQENNLVLSNLLFDAIISLAVCILFFYAGHIDKKRRQKHSAEESTQ